MNIGKVFFCTTHKCNVSCGAHKVACFGSCKKYGAKRVSQYKLTQREHNVSTNPDRTRRW